MSVRPVTHLEAAPPAPPSDETVPDSSHGPGSSPARLGPRQGSHPPSGPRQVLEAVTASAPGFLNCFLPGRGGEKVAVPDTCLPRGRTLWGAERPCCRGGPRRGPKGGGRREDAVTLASSVCPEVRHGVL